MMIGSQTLRRCIALILGLGIALSAYASSEVAIMSANLAKARDGNPPGLYLDLSVEFDLPRSVNDALTRGIPLYFVTEFILERQRWYWVDKPVVESTLISRLSYSPLTRQYRLSRGGLSQSFDTLKDALDVLKNIHQWRVSSRPSIDTPDNYEANVRIKLDTTQLPLPLQVTIGDNDWDISSEWYSLTLTEQALSADDSN